MAKSDLIVRFLAAGLVFRLTRGEEISDLNQIGFIPPDVTRYTLDDYSKHPCNRPCEAGAAPLMCKYTFKVELYETLNPTACRNCPSSLLDCSRPNCILADGVRTPVIVINRMLPGPTLNLCQNDRLVVDVYNALNETTTVHWHGEHQRLSPYMDGVGLVTQAPIPPGTSYRYAFIAEKVGTLFWHSHINSQRAFGHVGRMNVRVPPNRDPHRRLYDADTHSVLIHDWPYDLDLEQPRNILINGRGRHQLGPTHPTQGQYEWFEVTRGRRFRFRVISNTYSNCPLEVSVDDHQLQVISADGNDVQPVTVGSITMFPGERYDFVLTANQPVGNYWLRVRGRVACAVTSMFQGAIIHYQSASRAVPSTALLYDYNVDGLTLNAIDGIPGSRNNIAVAELNGLSNPPWAENERVKRLYVEFSRNANQFQIDLIGFRPPPVVVLLEKDFINDDFFCDRDSLLQGDIDCRVKTCQCTNVQRADLGDLVEIVFFGSSNHPVHLHGFTFNVVGSGRLLGAARLESVIDEDNERGLNRRYANTPQKDVIQMPRGGYAIVRFRADNPGFWLLHCHIETHSENGMTSILKVGQNNQMVPRPRNFNGFPIFQ